MLHLLEVCCWRYLPCYSPRTVSFVWNAVLRLTGICCGFHLTRILTLRNVSILGQGPVCIVWMCCRHARQIRALRDVSSV